MLILKPCHLVGQKGEPGQTVSEKGTPGPKGRDGDPGLPGNPGKYVQKSTATCLGCTPSCLMSSEISFSFPMTPNG